MPIIAVEQLSALAPARRQDLLSRSMTDITEVFDDVRRIVRDVRERGDAANIEEHARFKADLTATDFRVTPEEIRAAYDEIDPAVVEALRFAAGNLRKFHEAQRGQDAWEMEVAPGVTAGRITRPLDAVGCYAPGARAFYPSTVLMTLIPALAAGVPRVILCTPPWEGMRANAAYLVAADICGCSEIFKLGGPWAIASMAYGTATVPAVDKIVGPGNKYVIAAKMAVYGTVDIDSPAGPSEVLILADDTANPAWLAADLLAQMEHDPDAASVLVTPSLALAEAVSAEIDARWETLPRREILDSSRRHSAVLVADSLEAALDFANEYAAEHLEIVTADPRALLPRVRHAGSIFLGPYAPVPVGDYASGTNHVLPTGRGARMFSGLSVDEFMKKSTYQVLSAKGLRHLRDAVITLAEAEGLPLHADAVRRRDDA